ncbi:ankyrin repeat-containing domain protein [Mycena rebaudengoi]|nr:ankyrin repeat-containing domain protein [Mycena rebaudengoi]
MDPVTAVGLVASILQLVAAAKSVLDLGRDALNATKDQRDLLLEVANLAPLLEDLKHRVQQPNNQSVNGIQKLETPLGQLKETMEHINRKLGSANKVGSKSLMWAVWSKKEVDADLAKIQRFKAVLNAWLLLDNWDVGQQQEKNYNQIRQDQDPVEREKIVREREKIVKEREKIFDWLSPPNFFARHAEIFATRQKGTGLWFLDEKQFQDWLSAPGGTLWCHGIPGAGKTVLTSIVVDYLRNELQGNNTGVAAAYLNHKECDAQSPSNVLAGLWWQLVAERPILPAVQQLYEKHQNQRTRPSLDEVRNILTAMTAEYSKLFFVVDALDEYPEAHRDILLDALAAMGKSVSLMFTSRPNITPEAFFSTALVLEISAKDEDIRSYVRAQIQSGFRLSKHVRARPKLREEIETKIAENADGMFLIAKLHIDSLATKSTIKAVRDALQNLPEDLEHTYDEAMDWIEAQTKDDREIARRTLIWVANAKRPLTVFELQEALAIEPDSKALDADGLLDIEIIISVCVGLVIIDASQSRSNFLDSSGRRIVRLVHLTIQDYLDRVQAIRFPEAQTEITRNCLTYISYNDIPTDPSVQQRGLLLYAVRYCLLHAAGEPELLLRDNIIQFLKDAHRWRRHHRYFMTVPRQWYRPEWPPVPSKLWVAALFSLQEIARHILDSDKSISEEEKEGALNVALEWNCLGVARLLITHGTNGNTQRPFLGNVLRAASKAGHMKTVQLLLENGANVNTQGGEYGTALQAASAKGYMELVQLLLEHNADLNLQGGKYGTALQAASAKRSEGVVRLLLKHGADVNAQGGYYATALQAASAMRQMKMVQLLLKHGADANTQGGEYGTALQAASAKGYLELVQLLLEHNADPNLQGGKYGTALQAASANGYLELVQLLLEHGADPNLQGGTYGTALQAASWCGRIKVVWMLLVHGADVNAQGGEYGAALQAASAEGTLDVVQLLLEHGANVNGQDGQGGEYGTALQAASWKGNMKVVQMLLEHGADVDLQGGYYGTALQAASWLGNMEVVELLLENGADVNLQGGGYGTALQAASVEEYLELVQLFLKHGADPNLQGGTYGTALQAASWMGSMKVVQLLLENSAAVNVQGGEYGTALQAASWRGCMEVMQLLLEHGADVNLQGGEHGTALQAASALGETDVVQLLLVNGADVNLPGGPYGTALQAASVEGDLAVVQLLLENGADVNLQGGEYGTAYRAAKSKDHAEVAELLVTYGADTILGLELDWESHLDVL